jgi:uncharacterized membrane protein
VNYLFACLLDDNTVFLQDVVPQIISYFFLEVRWRNKNSLNIMISASDWFVLIPFFLLPCLFYLNFNLPSDILLALLIGLAQILSLIFIIYFSKPNLEECSLSMFLCVIFLFVYWLVLVLVVVLSLVFFGTALWITVLVGTILTEILASPNNLLWTLLWKNSTFFFVIALICHIISFIIGIVFLAFYLKLPSLSDLVLVFYILWGGFSFLRVFIPFVYLWRIEQLEQQQQQQQQQKQSKVIHTVEPTDETQYSETEQTKQTTEQSIGSLTEVTPLLQTTSQSINF